MLFYNDVVDVYISIVTSTLRLYFKRVVFKSNCSTVILCCHSEKIKAELGWTHFNLNKYIKYNVLMNYYYSTYHSCCKRWMYFTSKPEFPLYLLPFLFKGYMKLISTIWKSLTSGVFKFQMNNKLTSYILLLNPVTYL